MNSKKLLLLAIVIIAIGGFFYMKQDANGPDVPSKSSGNIIAATDGSASLNIPDSALPEGVSRSDVTMETQPMKLLGNTDPDYVGLEYVLEPSGIEFKKPVRFEITIDHKPNRYIMLLQKSKKGVEMLSNIEGSLSEDGNKATYAADVSHFSRIAFFTYQHFSVEMAPTPDQGVDQEFWVPVTVSKTNNAHLQVGSNGSLIAMVASEDPWTLSGEYRSFDNLIYPANITDPGTPLTITEDSHEVRQLFKCIEAGPTNINYSPEITWTVESYWLDSGEWFADYEDMDAVSRGIVGVGELVGGAVGGLNSIAGDWFSTPASSDEQTASQGVNSPFRCEDKTYSFMVAQEGDYATIADLRAAMASPRGIEEDVHIAAIQKIVGGVEYVFPFPDDQFTLEPAEEPTGSVYCANEHYAGAQGLNINDIEWVPEPSNMPADICQWGSMRGKLIVSKALLEDWLEAFGQ